MTGIDEARSRGQTPMAPIMHALVDVGHACSGSIHAKPDDLRLSNKLARLLQTALALTSLERLGLTLLLQTRQRAQIHLIDPPQAQSPRQIFCKSSRNDNSFKMPPMPASSSGGQGIGGPSTFDKLKMGGMMGGSKCSSMHGSMDVVWLTVL